MARSAGSTAQILADLYLDYFENVTYERYRIGWAELRAISGVSRLERGFLGNVECKLNSRGYLMFSCDNYFVIAAQDDFDEDRVVSQRLVEYHLYVEEENDEDDDDVFDHDV